MLNMSSSRPSGPRNRKPEAMSMCYREHAEVRLATSVGRVLVERFCSWYGQLWKGWGMRSFGTRKEHGTIMKGVQYEGSWGSTVLYVSTVCCALLDDAVVVASWFV